jgi:hypothetical protein
MSSMSENPVSPINDATKLDLLVERQDGGLEMCIVAQGSVDGSPETLTLIETKIRNYVREALDRSFRESYGDVALEKIRILFESRFAVDPAVLSLISSLTPAVEAVGLTLEYRRY